MSKFIVASVPHAGAGGVCGGVGFFLFCLHHGVFTCAICFTMPEAFVHTTGTCDAVEAPCIKATSSAL